jgi:hypothetical protein
MGGYLTAGGRPFFILKEHNMTQREIDRAVAASTGETLSQIRHLGFGIEDPSLAENGLEPSLRPPLMIDWDGIYVSDLGR